MAWRGGSFVALVLLLASCGDDEGGSSSGESGSMATTVAGSDVGNESTAAASGTSSASGTTSEGMPAQCGGIVCEVGQYCVAPCCGGAPEPTEGCVPPPAFCVAPADVECNDAGCQAENCFGELVGGVIECTCA